MTVVTRFAPSPTGFLHIGSLRTVLYNYLYAKQKGGKFMLRVEDTDRTRLVEGSVENMIDILDIMGLTPDEGPNNIGEKGPYYQSERLDIYKKYIDVLIKNNNAYYCFCDSDRLTKLREEQQSLSLPTKYDGKCRYLSEDEINEKLENNCSYTVRLKVPKNKEVVFEDIVKGKIKVHSKDIDDQVLIKSDGFPTYHLANVVDDYLMNITHVIRGDEWTPSTPKHILLYEAFGWDKPLFAHIPLLLGNDKKKLSKRTGDVSVEKYIEKGYLVESIINYISLLGWNPKTTEEFFTIDELIERFNINNIVKSGAVFDIERLDFFNKKYLAKLDNNYIYKKLLDYLKVYNLDYYKVIKSNDEKFNLKIIGELKTKITNFSNFYDNSFYFYNDIGTINEDLLLNAKMKIDSLDIVNSSVKIALEILNNMEKDFESIIDIRNIFIEKIKENNMKNGQVLWPIRVLLSGEAHSPGAFEMIYILGIKESINRINKYKKDK